MQWYDKLFFMGMGIFAFGGLMAWVGFAAMILSTRR